MRIVVLGTGYVGLVTGTCFAEAGNSVCCIDKDKTKIDSLRKGVIPIFEHGLTELVENNIAEGRLRFGTDLAEVIEDCEILFIAVGTPMKSDGFADLQYVLAAAKEIGQCMKGPMIVVNKSTVPVGTSKKVSSVIKTELEIRGCDFAFDVVSNPEFLREGKACTDFLHPDRVVVGASTKHAFEMMRRLYKPFLSKPGDLLEMDEPSAEMTKYASNAMLASRISFMNEIANICEKLGADVEKVRLGMSKDRRIGTYFLFAGCGYGGSCFPKDVSELACTGKEHGIKTELLDAVINVNKRQKCILSDRITSFFGNDLNGKVIAVWGLAFKPETDDMREAPSLDFINEVTTRGALVRAYDPHAMQSARNTYLSENSLVQYSDDKYQAVNGADVLVILTEWAEFLKPDFNDIKRRMKTPIILDGRNVYYGQGLSNKGFIYQGIGVG